MTPEQTSAMLQAKLDREQIQAVQPLLDEIGSGQHPDASPRFKPRPVEQDLPAPSLLHECSKWHAKQAALLGIQGRLDEARKHLDWSVACAEADEQ